MWTVVARCAPLLWIVAACGEPAARVQLVPIDFGHPENPCGKPAAGLVSVVRVIAYTGAGELRRTDVEISDFPADTEELGVELVGGTGAASVLATGKTGPLAYGELADQTQIPIAMLPPNGSCPIHDMTTPRAQPLLARAGAGVLVLGGAPDGPSAEYYDPVTASFTPVALPGLIADNPIALLGAAVATLADGRVVVSGGETLYVFDPVAMKFTSPSAISSRHEHAAIGLDANHVLLTGGCLAVGTSCDSAATPLHSSLEYELSVGGQIVGDGRAKTPLTASSTRYHPRIFDVGVVSDSKRRFMLVGATSDPATADRIPFDELDDSGATTLVAGTHAQVATLDGGGLLTAFDPDRTVPQTGGASILPPESGNAVAVALAPAIDGARLVGVEDGSVFAIGGDAQIARYLPTTNSWVQSLPNAEAPGAVFAPSLIRLDDGSVLVLGGTSPATSCTSDGDCGGRFQCDVVHSTCAPSAGAWLFRPSLVGPQSARGDAFADGTGAILTTPNQATATRTAGHLLLTAPADDLSARALVGGPRPVTGTLLVSAQVASGGVALIAQQTAPARALVARLVPGEAARIVRIDGSRTTTLCTGAMVTFDDLALPLQFVVTSTDATAKVGNADSATTKVSCDFGNDPIAGERGAWGIAATASGAVDVSTVTLSR